MTRISPLWPRALFVVALVVVGLVPAAVEADTRLVDCSIGRRIATALRLPAGRELILIIRGTCTESVTITRDDVTLRGDPVTGGTISGVDPNGAAVLIRNARRVLIDRLTVTGAGPGVAGLQGAQLTIQNSSLVNAQGEGVFVGFGASAELVNNQITGNGDNGVSIEAASASLISNRILSNAGHGVKVMASGFARIGESLTGQKGANEIASNAGDGINVNLASSAVIGQSNIHDNAVSGVMVNDGSNASLRQNVITRNGTGVFVNYATASMQGDRIETGPGSGIRVFFGSLRVDGATITGNTGDGINVSTGNLSMYNTAVTANGRGVSLSTKAVVALQDSTISGNTGDGITIFFNAEVVGPSSGSIINNGGFGVNCFSIGTSFFGGDRSRVTGNALGQVHDCP